MTDRLKRADVKHVAYAALIFFAYATAPVGAQAQTAAITGTVSNAAGQKVEGALIKILGDAGIGYTVVSQAQGKFATPALPNGKYTLQAFGGDLQSAESGAVNVQGSPQTSDVVLNRPLSVPAREKRMTDDDFTKLLPEGPAKRVIGGKCAFCHGVVDVISARKTPEKWRETYERMYDDLYGMRKPIVAQSNEDQENAVVLDYLSMSFAPNVPVDPKVVSQWFLQPGGPSHPNRNLPTTLLKGTAAKYVAMEFSLPKGSSPHDVAVDTKGNAWVTERNTGMLGRFDPATSSYTRVQVPAGKAKFQLDSVAVDSKGQVWFADDGPNARMMRFDPDKKAFDSYALPEYHFPVPDEGWARIGKIQFLNGSVWATGVTSQRILRLEPGEKKFMSYSIPRGSSPYGLAVGGDNLIWYAGRISNVVVKLDPATGKLTRHDSPTLRAGLRGLASDSEGNLWAAATESGKLVKVDYKTGAVSEFAPPTEDSGPYSIDVDTTRNMVWFSEIYADKIGRYNPVTNTFVEFPHPLADSDVRRLEVDRSHPNRVWWASPRNDKIGYLEVLE